MISHYMKDWSDRMTRSKWSLNLTFMMNWLFILLPLVCLLFSLLLFFFSIIILNSLSILRIIHILIIMRKSRERTTKWHKYQSPQTHLHNFDDIYQLDHIHVPSCVLCLKRLFSNMYLNHTKYIRAALKTIYIKQPDILWWKISVNEELV